jgi:hypothetical protein
MMANAETREPWLRGTLQEIPAVHRAVLHSFKMAEEDLSRSIKVEVKKKHISRGWNFSCFAAHLMERDLF